MSTPLLDSLWQRGAEFLGARYPIICGGMTWVSTFDLVKAVSENGAFGVLAGGNMPPEMFDQEVDRCVQEIDGPFAVNLVTIAPNYKQHLEILKSKEKVPIVIFAGGFPNRGDMKMMKDAGKKTMAFAATESMAKRTLKYGADALVIEGMEAGGHIGHVTLTVLIQEVLFNVKDVPVFVAGGLATGKMVAHTLLMGAAGAQMGTRFVMSEECTAHPQFKEAFAKAQARHAVQTPMIDNRVQVAAVRALNNQGMEGFNKLQIDLIGKLDREEITREEAIHEVESFWMGALRKGVIDGDIDTGSLMAGQSVGLVREIKPMKRIIEEIVTEAEEELQRVKGLF